MDMQQLLQNQQLLVTVKTYPLPTTIQGEIVCTAGITDKGEWIRIHNMPFRFLPGDKKFKKFQWIVIDLKKVNSDKRPETYTICNEEWKVGTHISTVSGWSERRRMVELACIDDSMTEILERMHSTNKSLTTLKPIEVTDFSWEPDTAQWPEKWMKKIQTEQSVFESIDPDSVVEKIPWKFYYSFITRNDNKPRKLSIIDWEIGALYRNLRMNSETEKDTLRKMKCKYLDDLASRDIHFFLGTHFKHQMINAPNPFMIIGVFAPPKYRDGDQLSINL